MQSKFLPVPDAREGDRLDAGLAKMLGISRTATADIIESGGVTLEGRPLGKSHRLSPGEVLEVTLLEKPAGVSLEAEDVPELKVVFQDEHIVVVDKPAGVVSHPSQGFVGPSVGGSAACKRD